MSKKEKMTPDKKRRSDSDGVTVKRSYYSFSKYYPGGGSSQKYRKVMKETPDEKRPVKIAFAVIGLLIAIFIGYFTTTVAMNISYAPTTEPTQSETLPQNEYETASTTEPESAESTHKPTAQKPSETKPIEEPEREVNVTSVTQAIENENGTDVTEVYTGY